MKKANSIWLSLSGAMVGFALALVPQSGAIAQEIQFQPTEDSPILAYNPAGPADLKQYDFLSGDWDVVVTMPQKDKAPFVYKAKWHNHWIANGYVMMQEWRGPYATGMEFRSFNTATKKWDGHNIYLPQPGTWYENQAEMVGDDMVVTGTKMTPKGQAYISREIYHAIMADSFSIRSEVSLDDGATWQPGHFSVAATRAEN